MARNPDIAQVPTSPNVTVRLEWEKKDERGVLVFSDARYAPISVEVEELKGTHQPITRIIYYRGGTGVARYVRPKSGAPLNAQSVMAGIEVTPDRMRSAQRMIGLKKIFFYKAVSLIKNGSLVNHPEFKRPKTLTEEIAHWAFHLYEEHGVKYDEAAMCDYLAAEVVKLDKMPQRPLVNQGNLRASITYQQFLKTPGLIDDLDAHDTALYCHARGMSINFISFLLALPKEEVKDIIKESRRAGKKTRSAGGEWRVEALSHRHNPRDLMELREDNCRFLAGCSQHRENPLGSTNPRRSDSQYPGIQGATARHAPRTS